MALFHTLSTRVGRRLFLCADGSLPEPGIRPALSGSQYVRYVVHIFTQFCKYVNNPNFAGLHFLSITIHSGSGGWKVFVKILSAASFRKTAQMAARLSDYHDHFLDHFHGHRHFRLCFGGFHSQQSCCFRFSRHQGSHDQFSRIFKFLSCSEVIRFRII